MIQDAAVTVVLNVCHGRDTDGENHRRPELLEREEERVLYCDCLGR